jgi:uncharacterized protein YacL
MRVDGDPEVAWLVRRAGHVSKSVKGLLIGLAAALGLELTQDAGAAALALAGTVIAVLLGNVYGDAIQHEIEHGRRLDRRALAGVVWHSVGVILGALPAFLLLVAAWLDVIDTQLAVDLVVWSGIGLLLVLGYGGGRLGGATPRGAVMHGVLLASLGVVVLAVKSLH